MASCATNSVSGRGTNTPGPTASSSERNGASPVMCCSGSRAARRSRAVRNAARSPSATVAPVTARACSCPLLTPSACPSSSSASTSGVGTPASASVRTPRTRSSTMVGCGDGSRGARPSSLTFGTEGGEARLFVHLDARVEDRLQGAVHHLVEVVGLVSRSVVGDPVLGEVVGADAFGAVHGADLAATLVGRSGIPLLLLPGEQPRAQHAHTGL